MMNTVDPSDLGPAQPPKPRPQPARPQQAIRRQPEVHYFTNEPNELRSSGSHWFFFAVAGCVVVAVNLLVLVVIAVRHAPSPDRPTPHDPEAEMVEAGRRYAVQLGPDFARAVGEGRRLFRDRKGRAAVNDEIAKTFAVNRRASFDAIVTPALGRVVAQEKPDKDLTADDYDRLDRAYAGLEKGASRP